MSLRTLIRIGGLALGLILSSPLLWKAAGSLPILLACCLVLLTSLFLLAAAGTGQTSRWQIRYWLETHQANERLDATLDFLAERAGHVVLEASSQGLVLEAPAAFDRYVQVQMEQALPEARVTRVSSSNNSSRQAGDAVHLCLDPLAGDLLRWATEGPGRQVRLHVQRGPHFTVVAQTDGATVRPGRWLSIPLPRPAAARLWRKLPVWDDLSTGVKLSHLLPTTDDAVVYSSRSRLLQLAPPDGYGANGQRDLGESTDGRSLSLSYDVPLFTAGAPPSFLVRQVLGDLVQGRAVVVVSPQRRTLNLIQRHLNGGGTLQAQVTSCWLDQESARTSAHLAVVGAGEWAGQSVETAIHLTEAFLADLGLHLHLPAVRRLIRHLIRILAASAHDTGHDFAFTDLYAISQSTQTLHAFLVDLQSLAPDPTNPAAPALDVETQDSIRYLAGQLETDTGYVQIVTILSTIRAALSPLRSGAVHVLCQPPFLNAGRVLSKPALFLVPLTNADFRDYDRFLAAVLDLTLARVLDASGDDLRLVLYLQDPQAYCADAGRRWIEIARRDPRLSLVLDVQEPDAYQVQPAEKSGQIVFRCSEGLADSLVKGWDLAYTATELVELPAGTALARLPDLPGPVVLRDSR
ncbi:MAG: hypothetical protein RBU35_20420 [Anaerolineae bacterium]|jgi:hypothetical protein|nr:hypothetical protein [Anaerolineae bacterium]